MRRIKRSDRQPIITLLYLIGYLTLAKFKFLDKKNRVDYFFLYVTIQSSHYTLSQTLGTHRILYPTSIYIIPNRFTISLSTQYVIVLS